MSKKKSKHPATKGSAGPGQDKKSHGPGADKKR
jgi:hypothetical protein